jgi:hypothetical protein
MPFDPNTAIDAVMGQGQQPQQAAAPLPPDSQALVELMLANLTANAASPDAVDAWKEARDAERTGMAAPAAPQGPVGRGPTAQGATPH